MRSKISVFRKVGRRNRDSLYRGIIALLLFVIFVQWMFLVFRKPPVVVLPPEEVVPPRPIRGEIAIVLDDWGYNLKNLSIVKSIPQALTIAVLPHLRYSSYISKELNHKNRELILHLPMEPQKRNRMEEETILVSDDAPKIKRRLNNALASVGNAKGVSNHMGSLATTDARTMRVVLEELKKRRLYFLDSFVVSDSVCPQLSRDIGLDFAQRDVFLDNELEQKYIRARIEELKSKAEESGSAIGIGHDRRITLKVLKEMLPRLEKEGFRFVFVSELAD